ncbi:MAG: GntR family transcriptional regulator [Planctomycetota bacterium]|nr:MAG: GntR family transcriptional regulator [Planctomycetota bacterium]
MNHLRDGTLRLRRTEGARPRCPFCRGAFLPGERVRRCATCGEAHHWECLALHGGCAVYGCEVAPPREDAMDEWSIDPDDPVPISEQITYRVLFAIAKGVYRPGDRLPTVREVAARLKVNPNTVSKAYRDLDRDGVLISRRGAGVFVHPDAPQVATERRQALVLARCERALGEALDAGLTPEEIQEVIVNALRRAARARGLPLSENTSTPRWAERVLARPRKDSKHEG